MGRAPRGSGVAHASKDERTADGGEEALPEVLHRVVRRGHLDREEAHLEPAGGAAGGASRALAGAIGAVPLHGKADDSQPRSRAST